MPVHKFNKQHANRTHKVISVANRLPLSISYNAIGEASYSFNPNALVSGLEGVTHHDILWIGWPGAWVPEQYQVSVREKCLQHGCLPVFLTEKMMDLYERGFSNSVLWPLLHYASPTVNYDDENEMHLNLEAERLDNYWDAYKEANQQFVDAIISMYSPGDSVWIHDYHLMLVPLYLRRKLNQEEASQCRICWSLHTPFPSQEIFRLLPYRESLLQGVLASNLAGFHLSDYMKHFLASCVQILGLEASHDGVDSTSVGGVVTFVQAIPIGIDFTRYVRRCAHKKVLRTAMRLHEQFGGRKVILGIDRLDWMRGIPLKLAAFEALLDEQPNLVEKVVFVQLSLPSNRGSAACPSFTTTNQYSRAFHREGTDIDRSNFSLEEAGYPRDLRNRVMEMVGRINGKHGRAGILPLHFLEKSILSFDLLALYLTASVLLVTSIRDGLNLTTYEYVATHLMRLQRSDISSLDEQIAELRHLMGEETGTTIKSLMKSDRKRLQRRVSRMFKQNTKFNANNNYFANDSGVSNENGFLDRGKAASDHNYNDDFLTPIIDFNNDRVNGLSDKAKDFDCDGEDETDEEQSDETTIEKNFKPKIATTTVKVDLTSDKIINERQDNLINEQSFFDEGIIDTNDDHLKKIYTKPFPHKKEFQAENSASDHEQVPWNLDFPLKSSFPSLPRPTPPRQPNIISPLASNSSSIASFDSIGAISVASPPSPPHPPPASHEKETRRIMSLQRAAFLNHLHQEGPGVLVLSEFTGASAVLGGGAIRVNPWSKSDLVRQLKRALKMKVSERKKRFESLIEVVAVHTAPRWGRQLMDALDSSCEGAKTVMAQIPVVADLPRLAISLLPPQPSPSPRLLVIIDLPSSFLTLLHARSQLPSSLVSAIRKLSVNHPSVRIIICSPLPKAHALSLLPRGLHHFPANVSLAAESGVFLLNAASRTSSWTQTLFPPPLSSEHACFPPWRDAVTAALQPYLMCSPGAILVQLTFGVRLEWPPSSANLVFNDDPANSAVGDDNELGARSFATLGSREGREAFVQLWSGPLSGLSNHEVNVILEECSLEVRIAPLASTQNLMLHLLEADSKINNGEGAYNSMVVLSGHGWKEEDGLLKLLLGEVKADESAISSSSFSALNAPFRVHSPVSRQERNVQHRDLPFGTVNSIVAEIFTSHKKNDLHQQCKDNNTVENEDAAALSDDVSVLMNDINHKSNSEGTLINRLGATDSSSYDENNFVSPVSENFHPCFSSPNSCIKSENSSFIQTSLAYITPPKQRSQVTNVPKDKSGDISSACTINVVGDDDLKQKCLPVLSLKKISSIHLPNNSSLRSGNLYGLNNDRFTSDSIINSNIDSSNQTPNTQNNPPASSSSSSLNILMRNRVDRLLDALINGNPQLPPDNSPTQSPTALPPLVVVDSPSSCLSPPHHHNSLISSTSFNNSNTNNFNNNQSLLSADSAFIEREGDNFSGFRGKRFTESVAEGGDNTLLMASKPKVVKLVSLRRRVSRLPLCLEMPSHLITFLETLDTILSVPSPSSLTGIDNQKNRLPAMSSHFRSFSALRNIPKKKGTTESNLYQQQQQFSHKSTQSRHLNHHIRSMSSSISYFNNAINNNSNIIENNNINNTSNINQNNNNNNMSLYSSSFVSGGLSTALVSGANEEKHYLNTSSNTNAPSTVLRVQHPNNDNNSYDSVSTFNNNTATTSHLRSVSSSKPLQLVSSSSPSPTVMQSKSSFNISFNLNDDNNNAKQPQKTDTSSTAAAPEHSRSGSIFYLNRKHQNLRAKNNEKKNSLYPSPIHKINNNDNNNINNNINSSASKEDMLNASETMTPPPVRSVSVIVHPTPPEMRSRLLVSPSPSPSSSSSSSSSSGKGEADEEDEGDGGRITQVLLSHGSSTHPAANGPDIMQNNNFLFGSLSASQQLPSVLTPPSTRPTHLHRNEMIGATGVPMSLSASHPGSQYPNHHARHPSGPRTANSTFHPASPYNLNYLQSDLYPPPPSLSSARQQINSLQREPHHSTIQQQQQAIYYHHQAHSKSVHHLSPHYPTPQHLSHAPSLSTRSPYLTVHHSSSPIAPLQHLLDSAQSLSYLKFPLGTAEPSISLPLNANDSQAIHLSTPSLSSMFKRHAVITPQPEAPSRDPSEPLPPALILAALSTPVASPNFSPAISSNMPSTVSPLERHVASQVFSHFRRVSQQPPSKFKFVPMTDGSFGLCPSSSPNNTSSTITAAHAPLVGQRLPPPPTSSVSFTPTLDETWEENKMFPSRLAETTGHKMLKSVVFPLSFQNNK